MSSSDTIGLAAYIGACRRTGVECILEFMTALSNGTRDCCLSHRAIPLQDTDLICICEALSTNVHMRSLDVEGNHLTPTCLPHLMNVMSQNPVLKELRMASNALGSDGCEVLCGVLTTIGLRVLDLGSNKIGAKGMSSLSEALTSPKCFLTELSLHGNDLNEEAMRCLARGLTRNERLKHLHLGSNPLGHSGGVQLSALLSSAKCLLHSLDVSGCSLGGPACEALCDNLMANKHLTYLNLRSNGIDDSAMAHVARLIRTNITLKKLYVGGNPIRADTTASLLKSAATNQGLSALDVTGCPVDVASGGLTALVEVLHYNVTMRNLYVEDIVAGQEAEEDIESALAQRRARGMPGIFIGKEEFTKPEMSQHQQPPTITMSLSASRTVVKSQSPPRVRSASPKTVHELLHALQSVDPTNAALFKDCVLAAFSRVLSFQDIERRDQDVKIARLTARVTELESLHTKGNPHFYNPLANKFDIDIPSSVGSPRSPERTSRAIRIVSPIRMEATPKPAEQPPVAHVAAMRSMAPQPRFVPVSTATTRPDDPKVQRAAHTASPVPPMLVQASAPAPRLSPAPLTTKSTPSLLTSCPGHQSRPTRAHAAVSPRMKDGPVHL